MRTIANLIKEFLKRHDILRLMARKSVYYLGRLKYRISTFGIKVSPTTILFESFMGAQYSCNPRGIYEAVINDNSFENYELVWAFSKPREKELFADLGRAQLIEYKSKEYYRYCAKAKYIITNSNLDGAIIPRKEQIVVQTWHGTPLKRLRCDIEAQKGNAINTLDEIKWKNDVDIVRYDFFLSPSRFCSEKFTTAFRLNELGIESILIETGYPRNDFLTNYSEKDVKSIKSMLGIDGIDKKIILYAPTFRDNQHKIGLGYVYKPEVDFERLQAALGDKYIILFRPHYFIANQFDFSKYEGFVYNVTNIDDIKELYIIADLLITDYSSVFFDYAVLKRPMLFYMYDLNEYADDIRGFYLDINELPGQIVQSEDELVSAIETVIKNDVSDKYEEFHKKFNSLEDGKAAKRVIKKVF